MAQRPGLAGRFSENDATSTRHLRARSFTQALAKITKASPGVWTGAFALVVVEW